MTIGKDYSLDAFNKFLDHAAARGLIKKNTALSRKAATNKILDVCDKSELVDLRELDLQHAFERFQNKSGMEYKPDSLQVYLSRARTALTDFYAFVDNPSSFKPSAQKRQSIKPRSNGNPEPGQDKTTSNKPTPSDVGSGARSLEGAKTCVVPVPLRENLTVQISNLPADLTEAEAERLAAIMKAYAVPSVK